MSVIEAERNVVYEGREKKLQDAARQSPGQQRNLLCKV